MAGVGGKAPRRRGDTFERATMARLAGAGYLAVRSAGSHGPADLVALRADRMPALIQCKISGQMAPKERAAFYLAAVDAGAVAVMAFRPGSRGCSFVRITEDGRRVPWQI